MLLSVEKGVTNGGTIVHYKSEATGREKERTEQLFTARRKTEKKSYRLKTGEKEKRNKGIKDKGEKAKSGVACAVRTLGNVFYYSRAACCRLLPGAGIQSFAPRLQVSYCSFGMTGCPYSSFQ
jgi:hypothetical protein